LTDIRNWTEILTPNLIITDLKVIFVSFHTYIFFKDSDSTVASVLFRIFPFNIVLIFLKYVRQDPIGLRVLGGSMG
jgi:hypothetical protein